MIRKDRLPDTWPADWDTTPQGTLTMAVGGSRRLVLCDDPRLAQWTGLDLFDYDERQLLDIGVADNAQLELVRIQRLDPAEPRFTNLRLRVGRDATVRLHTITLGGHHTRNNIEVRLTGEGATFYAGGLYLVDRAQEVDNYIFVEHAVPHCQSNELYKGIVDDSARARFNGHVLVQDGAVKTEAFQTNRNILLTDKAHVDTRPFLEIYNDDVKCSHGSTIGQLDEQAMFYLQTRGISQRTAMTMLSYAFCDEVIRAIGIGELREVVADMVKKRLHGEDTSCADCAIACSKPCNGPDAHFDIDVTKL